MKRELVFFRHRRCHTLPCPALPLGTRQHRKTVISGEEAARHRQIINVTKVDAVYWNKFDFMSQDRITNVTRPEKQTFTEGLSNNQDEKSWTTLDTSSFSFFKCYCVKVVLNELSVLHFPAVNIIICTCFCEGVIVLLWFFFRVVWVTANIRRCLKIPLRATKTGGTAAAKARVKGLQMGVKMETPAKVNPHRLAQAPQAVIKGWSLMQARGPPSCRAVVGLVEPISQARSHVWNKPFEQRL